MASDQAKLVDLIGRSALGDRRAFKVLYDETAPRIFALILKMLRDRPLAEEVLQETYLRVWHRAGDYHAERGQVLTWLVSIARYRALDLIRARRDEVEVPDDLAAAQPTPDLEAAARSDASRLHRCMQTLTTDQRQTISLAFFHGLTHDELARQLETPLGTVKTWIRRGLARLKECLER